MTRVYAAPILTTGGKAAEGQAGAGAAQVRAETELRARCPVPCPARGIRGPIRAVCNVSMFAPRHQCEWRERRRFRATQNNKLKSFSPGPPHRRRLPNSCDSLPDTPLLVS